MNPWNKYSLFRLLIFFALGIIFASQFDNSISIPLWFFAVSVILLILVTVFVGKIQAYKTRWISGFILALIMFAFGLEWSYRHDHRNHPQHITHFYNGSEPVLVRIKSAVEARPNSYKALAEVVAVETDSIWLKSNGNVLLYFSRDSLAERLEYGDRLLIFSRLNRPSPPANPGEFDYRRFLANKNIFFQSFVRQDEWIVAGRGYGNALVKMALNLRDTFIRVFEKNGIDGRDFAVATALVLGMSDYLDNDTRSQFSTAGAMHVLCVSGLHVGIIFLVLNSMLFFLNRNKYTRLLRALLLLAGIWFYALLTGLAPSVLRASTMFSFVIVGMSMNRRADIYNSLTASAFVLLLFNPFLIREVGFQLSYTAVIAIVSIQPRLYQLWRPKGWLPDKIWAITTVSIAAQLGTAPLGLYYFHQFPNYFIITNLIVIPLATLILYTGFLTVIFSFIPWLSGWISWALVALLKVMNFSVSFIDSLPYSATTGLFISMVEMLILFAVILAGFRALAFRKALLLQTALTFLVLFFGMGLLREHHRQNQQKMVVYAVRNNVLIDFIHGRNGLMLLDSAGMANPSVFDFQVAGHHVRCGIRNLQRISFCDLKASSSDLRDSGIPLKITYPLLQFNNSLILMVDRNTSFEFDEPLPADLLIVTGNHRNPAEILKNFIPGKVVISNAVSPYFTNLWLDACREYDLPAFAIRTEGAFALDL